MSQLDPQFGQFAQSFQQSILLQGSFFPYDCQGDLGQTFCFCDVGAYKDPMDTIPIGTVKACLDCETVIPGSTTLYPNSRYSHECVCPAGLLILEGRQVRGMYKKTYKYNVSISSICCDLIVLYVLYYSVALDSSISLVLHSSIRYSVGSGS